MNIQAEPVSGDEWDDDELHREVFVVEPADEGQRLDRVLATHLTNLSRSYLQTLITEHYVTVSDRTRKASYRVAAGEPVVVLVPPPVPADPQPEAIPLAVVYEDADVLVIDKPAGMVVHPAPGHDRGTLVNAVLAHAPAVQINGTLRPGIVHRLDKDTSGLVIVAKHDAAMACLVTQFQQRQVVKDYLALVAGEVEPDAGEIDVPLGRDPRARQRMAALPGGRPAQSSFQVLERFPGATLLAVKIATGRTHQIRVHCAFIGHPVLGDQIYGGKSSLPELQLERQFLHATSLALTLPAGDWREFRSPLPADLVAVLAPLRAAMAHEADA